MHVKKKITFKKVQHALGAFSRHVNVKTAQYAHFFPNRKAV